MHAKVSNPGLQFFAHAPGVPTCTLAEESVAHHLLKLEHLGPASKGNTHPGRVHVIQGWNTHHTQVLLLTHDEAAAWVAATAAELS
jgi:competence protein CoiA